MHESWDRFRPGLFAWLSTDEWQPLDAVSVSARGVGEYEEFQRAAGVSWGYTSSFPPHRAVPFFIAMRLATT